MEVHEVIPDHQRCYKNDGKNWRCKRRVMEDKKYCEIHYLKYISNYKAKSISRKISNKKDEALPVLVRCGEADGRRCSEPVVDDKQLCEIRSGKGEFGFSQKISTEEDEDVQERKSKRLIERKKHNVSEENEIPCRISMEEDEDAKEVKPKPKPNLLIEKKKKKKQNVSNKSEISCRISMEVDDIVPDHLRCNRTDGRQWRCSRRAVENLKVCEIHHLQGRHRQKKQTVPESLKIQRKDRKALINTSNFHHLIKIKPKKKQKSTTSANRILAISEALDKALNKMKLKKGDLQLELIRMFLQRQVDKQKKRNLEANCKEDVMKNLPNGFMSISPSISPLNFNNADPSCEIKIGIDSNSFITRRCFRSKNIEPLPIGPLKVLPFGKNTAKLKKVKKKTCHWCRKYGYRTMIKCLSCRKNYFCMDCIYERSLNAKEVKASCPVCSRNCRCKSCVAVRSKLDEFKVPNPSKIETCVLEL